MPTINQIQVGSSTYDIRDDTKFPKTGGTISNNVYLKSSSNGRISLYFRDWETDRDQCSIYGESGSFNFRQHAQDTSYGEIYGFPVVDTGRTKNSWYTILTTKNPVLTTQGGTGGTDTGWIELTNSSVYTGSVHLRKIGVFVFLHAWAIQLTNALTSNYIALTQLGADYKPLYNMCSYAGGYENGSRGLVMVSSSTRNLNFYKPKELNSWPTSMDIAFTLMYELTS